MKNYTFKTVAIALIPILALIAPQIVFGGVPAVLPDPDGSPPATNKPVKVFILSGQSNMVGFGRRDGSEPGTLKTVTSMGLFPHLVDGGGGWTVRNDVTYRGVISAIGNGPLFPQFGANTSHFGPELGFGHVLGYYFDEPVLLIKSSIGNRSLGWDCLPPGSPRYDYGANTFAGYGDSPASWPTNGAPSPFVWYAGKQYDDFFLDEADMGPAAWVDGTAYPGGCQVKHGGVVYNCSTAHASVPDSEPGVGTQWATYWNIHSVFNVTDILDDFASEYPAYAAQGFEIAGFAWWQGHKDQGEPYAGRYETNLVNFIHELRSYYTNRYPGQIAADAPFVLATIAFGGWDLAGAGLTVANGQLAVSGDTGNVPAFEDNVKTVEARGFWREGSASPTTTGYHYNHNAETYMLVGDALGRTMVALLGGTNEPPNPNPMGFENAPTTVDGTSITMTSLQAFDTTAVEYFFTNKVNGNVLDWSTNRVWTNTGLTEGVTYGYMVKARDATSNETAWSAEAFALATNDTMAPIPNPMIFAVMPTSRITGTAVDMTATNAVDEFGSSPVEYFFENTNNLNNTGWILGTAWTETGLTVGVTYGYRVKARDALSNETAWSAVALVTAMHETNPPTPNPMTFAIAPEAINETTIDMTATNATDVSGPVEYFFTNTLNGEVRNWNTGTVWVNTGLTPGVTYGYQVKARDAYSNETAWSVVAFALATNDIIAPTPNPMTFAVEPIGAGPTSVLMTATTASDPAAPVRYYFENTSNGTSSGWATNTTWIDNGVFEGTNYGYRVKARDAWSNETAWSAVFHASPATFNIMTNNAGDKDSWNIPENWSLGHVPFGEETAIIDSNVSARVNSSPPTFGGDLILRTGAFLGGWTHSTAFETLIPSEPPEQMVLHDQSTLEARMGNGRTLNFAPIRLLGDAEIWGGRSTAGHHGTRNFNYEISGPGMLTFNGVNNNTANFNAENTFSGGFLAYSFQNQGFRLYANVDGAFGPGDVVISNNATLHIASSNTIDDAATLYLDGPIDSRRDAKVYMASDETVSGLWIDGVQQISGTWGSSSSDADNVNDFTFSGTGILTVGGTLALSKSVSVTNVFFGSSLTYTIDVLNIHTTALGGIVVTDSLPAGITFDDASPLPATNVGNVYTWQVGTLFPGSNAVITIDATVTTPGPGIITNLASAVTTNAMFSSNVFTATALTPITEVQDVLALTKTVSHTNLISGTNLTYTITVTNISPNPAMEVEITDTLPDGIALVTSAPPPDTNTGNAYTYLFGTLAKSAGASITMDVVLVSSLPGVFSNLAVASTTNAEVITVNNRDTAITVVDDVDEDGVSDPFDLDDDNDRMPDADELIAGTLPQDSNSFLWVKIAKTNVEERLLTFPGVTGRTYRVQVRTNLLQAPWVDLQTNIPGPALSNKLMEIHRTNAWERVYYRIGVERP